MPTAAGHRAALASAAVIVGAVGMMAGALWSGTATNAAVPLALMLVLLATAHRALLAWRSLVNAIVLVIFFIPIKRYGLPFSLPFNLEPYRLLIGLVSLAWLGSLLIDRRLRVRASGLEGPVAAFVLVAVASVAVNAVRLQSLGLSLYVVKTLTFFASFFLLFYFVVGVVRSRRDIDRVLGVMVASGAIVAVAAIIEYRTHDNLFNHLSQFVPVLHFNDPRYTAGLATSYLDRSGSMRAYASSAHPIELSAVLVMLLPLALYLARSTGRRRWLVAALLLGLGVFSTLSRTGIVMLAVVGATYMVLRPRQTRRLLPLLVPAMCAIYIAVPHTLGSLYAQFFPKGGLVAQQDATGQDNNHRTADGRLADIGPSLSEWSQRPILGEGFGSRLTDKLSAVRFHVPLARILDDQWLSSLLETGLAGVAALLWLLRRPVRRLKRIARSDEGPDGWLAVALIAAVDAFAVGMLTFDALGFVQVTILLFLMLALSSSLVAARRAEAAPA